MIKIICVNCETHVYNYMGKRKGAMKSELIEPMHEEYRKPAFQSRAICPECGKDLFYNTTNKEFVQKWQKKLQ